MFVLWCGFRYEIVGDLRHQDEVTKKLKLFPSRIVEIANGVSLFYHLSNINQLKVGMVSPKSEFGSELDSTSTFTSLSDSHAIHDLSHSLDALFRRTYPINQDPAGIRLKGIVHHISRFIEHCQAGEFIKLSLVDPNPPPSPSITFTSESQPG